MLRAQLRFFNDGCDTLKKFEPVIEQMGTEVNICIILVEADTLDFS